MHEITALNGRGDSFEGHYASMAQNSAGDVMAVIDEAYMMQHALAQGIDLPLLRGKKLSAVMCQDSSRTGGSFVTAIENLGGLGRIPNLEASAMQKGEDLNDSVLTFGTQADIIALRTADPGAVGEAISKLQEQQQLLKERDGEIWDVRVINAGDGTNEHPTQTEADLFAFHKRFGKLDGLRITMVGLLDRYRVTNSLAIGASLFNMDVNLVAPPCAPMQQRFVDRLHDNGCRVQMSTDIRDFLDDSDVLFIARPAFEYKQDKATAEDQLIQDFLDRNRITPELMAGSASKDVAVAHALPRNAEIDRRFDADWRNIYISQMRGAIPTRMARLAMMYGRSASEMLDAENLAA